MQIFQTDQSRCYDEKGGVISCADTGQDGEIRAGLPWPEPRFTVDGNLVTDHLTGLVWPRDAGISQFPLSWEEAFDFVRQMNEERKFGRYDWQLPDRAALFSLVSHDQINPAVVRPDLFENLFNGYYWSATPCARHPDQAWYIHMGGGRVVRGMKHSSYMIWPVCRVSRIEKSAEKPGERFTVHHDHVVDRHSRLTWLRRPGSVGSATTWPQAFEQIEQMNRAAVCKIGNWRLPNIRELASLMDEETHSPAIFPDAGFETVGDFYWSSTTSVYDPAYAWTFYARDGYIGVGYKPDPQFSVWPVCTQDDHP